MISFVFFILSSLIAQANIGPTSANRGAEPVPLTPEEETKGLTEQVTPHC